VFADSYFYGHTSKSGIAESNGSSIFSFLRNLHIDFFNGWTNLHSHQPCLRITFYMTKFVLFSLDYSHLTGVKWNLNVLLICFFFMAKDVQQFFMHLIPFILLLRNV
jgi:hypothetical protein